MMNKKSILVLIGLMLTLSLACTLGSTTQPETPVSKPVEPVTTQQENPTAEPTLQPTAVELRSNKGQIAYSNNGNVFVQNLETNSVQQLTFDADANADFLHVYHSITFSDSGRYLAFEFGHSSDETTASYVFELSNFTQTAYLEGEKIMGWLWNEDVLWIGHNTQECQDGMTAADNEKISFEVIEFSANSGNKSMLTTIPGGYLLPMSVGTRQNWMYFHSCPCDYYECAWYYPTYHLQSGKPTEFEIKGAYQISPNGGRQIPIEYSIHQPEAAGLEITDANGENPVEIYREEGKFIVNAQWSPLDDWIIFLFSDTINRDWFELRMIRPDGRDLRTISFGGANVVNWMPGGETMILLDAEGNLQTYHLETGKTEILTKLKGAKQVNWSLLP
jgi:hypothetical protein